MLPVDVPTRIVIKGYALLVGTLGLVLLGLYQLATRFTYEYLSRGMGSAIYQLRQGEQRLEFSSAAPLAKYVVRDLLGLEWPPADHLAGF
jgi:hypothetical protein